jgi:hypothetical protein
MDHFWALLRMGELGLLQLVSPKIRIPQLMDLQKRNIGSNGRRRQ